MKKYIIISLVIIPLICRAQPASIELQLKGMVNRNISVSLSEGTDIHLISITKGLQDYSARIIVNGEIESIGVNQLNRITFQPNSLKEFWQIKAIESGVYTNLIRNGFQYKERSEYEEFALDYLNYLRNNDFLIDDLYLESYLYSLIHRLYPTRLDDGRPGILNVHIVKDISPNAAIFPNGTMLINTGLLSAINSEEELMAVIAHEIAHFVLDHSVININKAAQRQRRAEFWSAVFTGIAAVADIYASTKNEYHVPGDLTFNVAILSYSVSSAIADWLGMKYSREQEMEADACAAELLKYIGLDRTALSSALSKIRTYAILTGNHLALSGEGTHPALSDRINTIGRPAVFKCQEYDKKISPVNSFNARVKFHLKHMAACTTLLERNIVSKVATEEDYILLSKVTLFMYDTEEKNLEALEYINIAKSLNIIPVKDIHKQEAIVLIRLKRMEEARNSLIKYQENLLGNILALDKVLNENLWAAYNSYLQKESTWTLRMLHKVNHLGIN